MIQLNRGGRWLSQRPGYLQRFRGSVDFKLRADSGPECSSAAALSRVGRREPNPASA